MRVQAADSRTHSLESSLIAPVRVVSRIRVVRKRNAITRYSTRCETKYNVRGSR